MQSKKQETTISKTKRRLVFTKHVWDRCHLYKLTGSELRDLFENSTPEKPPKKIIEHAHNKYRDKQEGVYYLRNGKYLMVVKDIIDKVRGDEIHLLITVCDQEINLKKMFDND